MELNLLVKLFGTLKLSELVQVSRTCKAWHFHANNIARTYAIDWNCPQTVMLLLISLSRGKSQHVLDVTLGPSMTSNEAFLACSHYIRGNITLAELVKFRKNRLSLTREYLLSVKRMIEYKTDEFAILAVTHKLVPEHTQFDHISAARAVHLRLLLCLEQQKHSEFWDDEQMTVCLERFQQCLSLSRAHQPTVRTC